MTQKTKPLKAYKVSLREVYFREVIVFAEDRNEAIDYALNGDDDATGQPQKELCNEYSRTLELDHDDVIQVNPETYEPLEA